MALVDTLLANGTVTQDPENADKVIFNVPIFIKKSAVNAGGFEAFAGEYGWTSTVKNENGDDIPNPMPVYEKCQRIIWGFVADVFRAAIGKQIDEQAQAQKEQMLGGLM